MVPQPSSTRTSHAPMVAAAASPAARYASQRTAVARLRQLGRSNDQPAWTATAGTAAPAPAPAPSTHSGGELATKSTDSARMTIRPGRMNPAPPTSAPARPRSRQAQKMASWVEAGPGIRLQTAIASSNSRASSQPLRSTHSWRSSLMCAGGPPKPIQPIRPHSRSTVPSATRGTAGGRSHGTPGPGPGPGASSQGWLIAARAEAARAACPKSARNPADSALSRRSPASPR